MGSILVFLSALLVILAFWLSRQGLASKPWLEQGVIDNWPVQKTKTSSPAKMGLGVFLGVVSSLFALFISAYAIRMQMPDWRSLPMPKVLWLNTGMLILSSLALHNAQRVVRRGEAMELKWSLLAAGVAALAFLSGQLLAWRQLMAEGYFLAANSANAFFFMLTGVHGLHLLGGLVALGRTFEKFRRGLALVQLRLSVELCATYWHFLLLVWIVLFGVLTGWAGDFLDICRQLLT